MFKLEHDPVLMLYKAKKNVLTQEYKWISPSRRPPSEVYHGAEWEQLEGHLILNGNRIAQINSCPFKFPIKRKTIQVEWSRVSFSILRVS